MHGDKCYRSFEAQFAQLQANVVDFLIHSLYGVLQLLLAPSLADRSSTVSWHLVVLALQLVLLFVQLQQLVFSLLTPPVARRNLC